MYIRLFPIITILVLLILSDFANAQTVTTPYVYPVVPGTPQWKALKTQQEMLNICQVPQDILTNMATDALVTTCMSYPLFETTLIAHGGGQRGLNELLKEFNGLRELIKRKDAGACILMRYQAFDPLGYDSTWSSARQGGFFMTLYNLEVLLSQDSVLSNMSVHERRVILSQTVEKFKLQQQRPKEYTGFTSTNSAFLAGRIMVKEGYEEIMGTDSKSIHLSDHVKLGKPMDKSTVISIFQQAQQLVNNSK